VVSYQALYFYFYFGYPTQYTAHGAELIIFRYFPTLPTSEVMQLRIKYQWNVVKGMWKDTVLAF
jgi:hypothetical protein